MHIRTHMRTYVHTYTHMYMHTYIHTHTHTHAYIHTCVYFYVCMFVSSMAAPAVHRLDPKGDGCISIENMLRRLGVTFSPQCRKDTPPDQSTLPALPALENDGRKSLKQLSETERYILKNLHGNWGAVARSLQELDQNDTGKASCHVTNMSRSHTTMGQSHDCRVTNMSRSHTTMGQSHDCHVTTIYVLYAQMSHCASNNRELIVHFH